MSEPKPFASLGPSLLARKGGARPAMRPQLASFTPLQVVSDHDDDLGWNDMGHDHVVPELAPALTPALAQVAIEAPAAVAAPVAAPVIMPVPEVVRQQQEISRRISGPRRCALDNGRRAAFTLRVDAERHLKLRLACTLSNRSAQQLVTEALDRLLDEFPDVSVLAAQVAKTARK